MRVRTIATFMPNKDDLNETAQREPTPGFAA
jgi:hypothetical protein